MRVGRGWEGGNGVGEVAGRGRRPSIPFSPLGLAPSEPQCLSEGWHGVEDDDNTPVVRLGLDLVHEGGHLGDIRVLALSFSWNAPPTTLPSCRTAALATVCSTPSLSQIVFPSSFLKTCFVPSVAKTGQSGAAVWEATRPTQSVSVRRSHVGHAVAGNQTTRTGAAHMAEIVRRLATVNEWADSAVDEIAKCSNPRTGVGVLTVELAMSEAYSMADKRWA
eukprot:2862214-Prymnesium_polylepis.1